MRLFTLLLIASAVALRAAAVDTSPATSTTIEVTSTTTVNPVPPVDGDATTASAPTADPGPDVENFAVTCSKATNLCTYTMQVPGLDIDTFTSLQTKLNSTEDEVNAFAATDFVSLQEGVTQAYKDAGATNDYLDSQLEDIKQQIIDLNTQASQVTQAIKQVTLAVTNANSSMALIKAKPGSCLYRQCISKETTTPKPTTTTTVKTTKTPFCSIEANEGICQHNGTCTSWYDAYKCTCKGNLDGTYNDCSTSLCDIVKEAQVPGLVYSPGYNGTTDGLVDCDGAQWTIKSPNGLNLTLAEEADTFNKGTDFVQKLGDANLQLTVGKYKLKITPKTKWAQITQILAYGDTATIAYTGTKEQYFHFTITELPPPTTTTTKTPEGK